MAGNAQKRKRKRKRANHVLRSLATIADNALWWIMRTQKLCSLVTKSKDALWKLIANRRRTSHSATLCLQWFRIFLDFIGGALFRQISTKVLSISQYLRRRSWRETKSGTCNRWWAIDTNNSALTHLLIRIWRLKTSAQTEDWWALVEVCSVWMPFSSFAVLNKGESGSVTMKVPHSFSIVSSIYVHTWNM